MSTHSSGRDGRCIPCTKPWNWTYTARMSLKSFSWVLQASCFMQEGYGSGTSYQWIKPLWSSILLPPLKLLMSHKLFFLEVNYCVMFNALNDKEATVWINCQFLFFIHMIWPITVADIFIVAPSPADSIGSKAMTQKQRAESFQYGGYMCLYLNISFIIFFPLTLVHLFFYFYICCKSLFHQHDCLVLFSALCF